MLGHLSADIICSEKRTVFRERTSKLTVSFDEHKMSKDKYTSIFLTLNGGYYVYYPSTAFRITRIGGLSLGYSSVLDEAYSVT